MHLPYLGKHLFQRCAGRDKGRFRFQAFPLRNGARFAIHFTVRHKSHLLKKRKGRMLPWKQIPWYLHTAAGCRGRIEHFAGLLKPPEQWSYTRPCGLYLTAAEPYTFTSALSFGGESPGLQCGQIGYCRGQTICVWTVGHRSIFFN